MPELYNMMRQLVAQYGDTVKVNISPDFLVLPGGMVLEINISWHEGGEERGTQVKFTEGGTVGYSIDNLVKEAIRNA